jgi:Metallo-peptidase family M12B Reprolysin-like/Secretion system C-terminal sorting domain/Proprotein convertase P-domain
MNKIILLLVVLCSAAMNAQKGAIWTRLSPNYSETQRMRKDTEAKTESLYALDETVLREKLAPLDAKKQKIITLEFPNSNGNLESFLVQESSNFESELQAKYPNIRAYSGKGIVDNSAVIHFSMSPDGLQTMLLRTGNASEFIEKKETSTAVYEVFDATTKKNSTARVICQTKNATATTATKIGVSTQKQSQTKSNNQVFKTLRLALSCTGEYAAYFGGTKAQALAAMNATMTRVNGVYNRDLSVKLVLIANNDFLIYTNAATDPYSESDAGAKGAWNLELQQNLTATITNSGYDIGHLFGDSGGGGDAGCIGCVCENPPFEYATAKGGAFTSPADRRPKGDSFDISFVAHEMGHQLGATHTYTSKEHEDRNANIEPGDGTTIMSYAGINDYSAQAESDDYFNAFNIQQIQDNLALPEKTCAVNTPIPNAAPTANAGSDYSIPISTPFVLKGTGSSSSGAVSFCWEQNDSPTTLEGVEYKSIAYPTKPEGPLFRSFPPSSLPIRYMPDLSYVLSGNLSPVWESVSDIAKTLHFNFTVRDNALQGQTNTDSMIVNVMQNVGPFQITSQYKENLSWEQGANETINWDVANANKLPGSGNVNIKLSTDGGKTFPTVLLANTPNDGSATIVVPDVVEKNCRVLVEPTDNIYYAINSQPIAIGYTVTSVKKTYDFVTAANPYAIPESASFNSLTTYVPLTPELVTKVVVNTKISHTSFSDLQLEIVNPLNTTVKLLEKNCLGKNQDLNLHFEDLGQFLYCADIKEPLKPEQTILAKTPLQIYNNTSPQGNWTLRIKDGYRKDIGTLHAASITIFTKKYTPTKPSLERNKFVVYPNPITSDKKFTVEFYTNSTNGATVMVYDLLGRTRFEKHFDNKGNHRDDDLELKNFLPGIYILSVIDENEKQVKKIAIK